MAAPPQLIPWKPGQSGNPLGRPKQAKDWAERCREYMTTGGGFDKLKLIADGKGDPKDQLKAIQFIADHAYGKAVTQIAGADENEWPAVKIITGVVQRTQLEIHEVKEYTDPRQLSEGVLNNIIEQLPEADNDDASG